MNVDYMIDMSWYWLYQDQGKSLSGPFIGLFSLDLPKT